MSSFFSFEIIKLLDTALFRWLNSLVENSVFWQEIAVFSASYLVYFMVAGVVFLAVVTLIPIFRERRGYNLRLLSYSLVSAVVARLVFTEAVRFFYDRPRPFELFDSVRVLISHPGGGSFPSGHASFTFALAAAVYFYYPRMGILFFILAFLVGLGRVVSGVHWPSDILAGAIVGVGTAFVIRVLVKKFLFNRMFDFD